MGGFEKGKTAMKVKQTAFSQHSLYS